MPRVELRPGAALGLALVIALDPAGVCLPFLLAALLHESGHLLCLRLCRVPVSALRIGLFGAVIDAAPRSERQEFFCTAAGPAVNLLAALLFRAPLPLFAVLNLLLALYNLLPVWPLDGGRMLRALLPRASAVPEMLLAAGLFLAAAYLTLVRRCGLFPMILWLLLLGKAFACRAQEINPQKR